MLSFCSLGQISAQVVQTGQLQVQQAFDAHCSVTDVLSVVEFLRALGSQSGMSVWQHTLVG